MVLADAVHEAVARLRLAGTDSASVEAKAAERGAPRALAETVSAFANGDGGLVVLGLDEATGFTPVPVDVRALADALATACADQVEPPVRAEIDVVAVSGVPVVAAFVPPLDAVRKPCFVRSQGLERGSYLRTHDGNRHLTSYEVHVLVSGRGQPHDDTSPVRGATLSHLDARRVDALLDRLRRTRGAIFADTADAEVLRMLGVLSPESDGEAQVTLAGLLALGRYPQQFVPQLNTTVVAYPTTDATPLADGTRFIDNVVADGPIPAQIALVLTAVQRNMSRRGVIVGLGREDRWDYPVEAVREVLVNALMHRDYHPLAHGAQVRVELYPDRLVVTSPGGLHGPVPPDALLSEPVSSSRNAVLAKLLEDVEMPGTGRTVCENRGTGLLAVSAALRAAGMEPPGLRPTITSFAVEFSNHTLLDREALDWLSSLDTAGLDDHQRLALAYVRRHGRVTNTLFRALTGVDGQHATRDLVALGSAGLLRRESAGRSSSWQLVTPSGAASPLPPGGPSDSPRQLPERQRQLLALLASGARTTAALADALGLTRPAVLRHLRALEDAGVIAATAQARRSRLNAWVLLSREPPDGTTRAVDPLEGDSHG